MLFFLDNLQISQLSVSLQCVFHSIRFKVGVQRYSFFYARTFQHPCFPFASLHFHMSEMKIPEY